MSDDVFDQLMGSLDRPMCIVTAWSAGRPGAEVNAGAGGERSGCLVGFSTQVSMQPSRFLVLISKTNHTFGVAKESAVLGVHVLRASDHAIASRFGELTGDEVDKFAGLDVCDGPGRVPILAGLDWFAGRVLRQHDLGDHVGFLLAPHDGSAARRGEPQLGLQDVRDLDAGHEA